MGGTSFKGCAAVLRLSVVDAANPGNRCGGLPEQVAIATRNS
jgi:hypothetical protein